MRKGYALLLTASALPLLVGLQAPQKAAAKVVSGESIFAKECASCHGAKGIGGAGYPKPLTGSKTPTDLAAYISKSMPPGGKTPPAKAAEIAKYMHDAFYSPVAQERIRPPRVALARLTVKQFRNALADLIGPEHPAISGELGGLAGHYYKARPWDDKTKLIQRTDATINFDFGSKAPSDAAFDLWNFSIVWLGNVVAPESGDYDFILKTNQGAYLKLNSDRDILVDARVRSGNQTEFKGTTYLVGGRSYPILLEWTKTTTGVNDEEKKKKIQPGPAYIQLHWKRPKLAPELIPAVFLSPQWSQQTYICDSPFPADDRSIGYDRGNAVSKEWDEAGTRASLEAAEYVSKNLERLSGLKADDKERIPKLKQGLKAFLTRAFRQPLTPEQEQFYIERQFASAPNPEAAIKRIVLFAFKSPRFLYREIGNRKDPFQLAAELSFGLWDTIPDTQLLQATARGDLNNPEGRAREIARLANDPRAYNKLRDFLMAWLKVEETPDIVKNQKAFPTFTDETVTDLRTSLDLFLKDAAWGKDGSFQKLLTSRSLPLNGKLSQMYGGNLPATSGFKSVQLPERIGVLSHPYLLSRLAYNEGSSPIHRGVLIARNMMGRILAPPPVAVAPAAASLQPSLTTRERVTQQTKPEACIGCHSLINPLGFPLEKFDAVGKLRTVENNKPIDTSGSYTSPEGGTAKFANLEDLANYIANSEESQTAFVEKLFQHLTKQPIRAYGKNALPNLVVQFKKDNYNIRSLMVAMMITATGNPQ